MASEKSNVNSDI